MMEETETTLNTTAFLFGNIDKKGQLESDDCELVAINRLSECHLKEINETIQSLFTQQDVQEQSSPSVETPKDNIEPVDYYDETEVIDDCDLSTLVDTAKLNNNQENYDDDDDCVLLDGPPEILSAKMLPPSEMPLVLQNKQSTGSMITAISSELSTIPAINNHLHIDLTNEDIHHKENVNTLNTPLGSILPPEYANVDIRTLFPHFHPDKVPRWSKLFKTFHEPQLYRTLDVWKMTNNNHNHSQENNVFPVPQQQTLTNGNDIYIYNEFGLNMGVPAPPEFINPNDADIIKLPAQSFADCELPVPFRDIQPCADNISLTQTTHPNHHNSQNINNSHHISNGRLSSADDNFSKNSALVGTKSSHHQQHQDALMLRRKRKREDRLNRLKLSSDKTDMSHNQLLISLSWRDGPASYWYDQCNFPLEANLLDYKIRPAVTVDEATALPMLDAGCLFDNDSRFSTWQLVHWENDIIIDPSTVKKEITDSNRKYACHAGWIPSLNHRNMASFQNAYFGDYFGIWPSSSTGTNIQKPNISHWHSIFALENAEMAKSDWMKKIIIDPRNTVAQEPYLLELDLNNEYIHYDFTNPQQTMEILTSDLNDVFLTSSATSQPTGVENSETDLSVPPSTNNETPNKDEKQMKKMKILSKFSENPEIEEKPKDVKQESANKDTINFTVYSNKLTYQVFSDQNSDKDAVFTEITCENTASDNPDAYQCPLTAQGIQHSLPAVRLDPLFFPLKMDNQVLRHLHRPKLCDVRIAYTRLFDCPQMIYNLMELLKLEEEQRLNVSELTGNGDLFFMRSINDLSATTDHLIFVEYSEEFPPLMNHTGMASRIINYFFSQPNQAVIMPQIPYGDFITTQQVPFLGQLSSGNVLQSLENNMFRAPIYPHKMKDTDFLLILKPNAIFIRRVDDIFVSGQHLPLIEVPAPNSKKANTFLKEFLHVQIIRLFLQSDADPKRVRHDEIKMIFSEQSDSALKKRLKNFAEYRKAETGNGGGFWVLKPEFQLPTEDELLDCITPEECCAYYSMMWGLCRLEDAGYNSKSLTQADPDQQDDDEEKESNVKIEDEVKAAPWHTTKTYLDAQKGKCFLELNGSTDPTGIGEGFSYARVSTKASLFKETLRTKFNKPTSTTGTNVPGVGKRMVTGTDADLRKLTLKKAYALLKECGIAEQEIKKLKRWDIIDLVREMSTQKAKQGEEEGMTKFARSSRLTVADQEERYRAECQRIFNLQNKVLSNEDELTSDDGVTDDEDDNCEDIDNRMNDEDMEMLRLKKSLESGKRPDFSETNSLADGTENVPGVKNIFPACQENAKTILKFKPPLPKAIPKALCIRRWVDSGDGTKVLQRQTIPWSSLLKIYFKMNEAHKTDFLREFCGLNESREEEKKAKKKQQDKIRRMKHKQQLQCTSGTSGLIDANNPMKRKYRSKLSSAAQLKQKVNHESPMNIVCGACGNKGHMRTNKECPLYGKQVKKTFKRSLLQKAKSKTIYQLLNSAKMSKVNAANSNQPATDADSQFQNLDENGEQVLVMADGDGDGDHGQDISGLDPSVPIDDEDDSAALKLVIPKQLIAQYSAPNSNPNVDGKNRNKNRKMSKADLAALKRTNSTVSGKKPIGSKAAGSNSQTVKQNEYMAEQKMKGNRRRIDPRVALNHQFEEIYKGLLQVQGYRCFLHPVRKRDFPNYYSVIDSPMDLATVKMKINSNFYQTRESFLQDIKLIYDNCIRFNGEKSEYSTIAKQLMSYVMEQFCAKERKLMRLERLVNPLMDEDDMVGMKYLLDKIVDAMEEVEHSRPFHIPVDKKKYPDYAERISRPMDLMTLRANIKADKYKSREDFLSDANLIISNCITYNGENNLLTTVARKMIDVVIQKFQENDTTLCSLETNLKMQYDDASDSQMAASSCMTDHLSHMGEDHTMISLDLTQEADDISVENDSSLQPSSPKRRRMSESFEEEKPTSISTGASIDGNRERILADLHLTDSEDEDNRGVMESRSNRSTSIHLLSDTEDIGYQKERNLSQSSDKQQQYDSTYQMSESNSESQSSPHNVKFYIGDDDSRLSQI